MVLISSVRNSEFFDFFRVIVYSIDITQTLPASGVPEKVKIIESPYPTTFGPEKLSTYVRWSKFSIFSILFFPKNISPNFKFLSRFSIFRILFAPNSSMLNSVWFSRFSIFEILFPAKKIFLSFVNFSIFSILRILL